MGNWERGQTRKGTDQVAESYRPDLSILSEQRINSIVDEAFEILDEVGVLVQHPEAVELLAGAGARVADDGAHVFLDRQLCEQCLASAPSQFRLFDRNGENPVTIGGRHIIFDPGSSALSLYDFDSGEIRAASTDDVIDFTVLTAQIPTYDCQSTGLIPSDVPEVLADRFRLLISLVYGSRPVITGTFTKDGFETMHGLLSAVRGGAQKLRDKPLAVFDCCPTAPLTWSELTCDALLSCARTGVPAEIVSMPLMGATAPVTLAGSIVQHTAETISGIVIHQLAGSGMPVVYGGAPALFDMRKGTTAMGSSETMLIDSAYSEIGRHFDLPVQAYMGLSDAKRPDYQAGFETAIGVVMASLAGVNVVSGPGMLNFVNTQSLEKLLLDAEICEMGRRLIRGVEFRGQTEAIGLLQNLAADRSFMSSTHTRKYFHQETYYPSDLIDRGSEDEWNTTGRPDSLTRAHDRVRQLVANADNPPLDPAILAEFESIIERDARDHGIESLPDWKGRISL